MRRSEREVTDPAFMQAVLEEAGELYVSLNTDGAPYMFCVNHFFHEGEIYFHCAPEGRKIDLLRRDPRAGFFTATDIRVEGTTTRYRSVYGTGTLEPVEDSGLKAAALRSLAKKYRAPCKFPVSEAKFAATMLIHIRVASMTCKYSRPGEGPRPVPHYAE
ncbi:MAG: pyridoxamine 5'-phosphate oxidase family protein [Mailhella sp.]|nr:pyridoxamine 5'-phosphate oxidase family protein [Mailhella sp.]